MLFYLWISKLKGLSAFPRLTDRVRVRIWAQFYWAPSPMWHYKEKRTRSLSHSHEQDYWLLTLWPFPAILVEGIAYTVPSGPSEKWQHKRTRAIRLADAQWNAAPSDPRCGIAGDPGGWAGTQRPGEGGLRSQITPFLRWPCRRAPSRPSVKLPLV